MCVGIPKSRWMYTGRNCTTWRGEAVQVEVPHELPQIHLLGEVVGGINAGGVRRDVLLREPVHALLELLLGVVEE